MMRSLYSGVSGLNNHQTKMDVLSNNIGNVNTHGFKKNRVTFQDLFYQKMSSASRPEEPTRGGINPKQVGLGMAIASIDTIHNQGALQTTGSKTDLAITGDGFFMLSRGNENFYTRMGAFNIDANGNLVNPANGFQVMGYQATRDANGNSFIDISSRVAGIKIPVGDKIEARQTTEISYKSNLNKGTPIIPPNASNNETLRGTHTTSIEVIDSRGQKQLVELSFTKSVGADNVEVPNQWRVTTRVFEMVEGQRGLEIEGVQAAVSGQDTTNDFLLQFSADGRIQSLINPNNATEIIGEDGQALTVALNYNVAGSDPMNINLNLGTSGTINGITQFATPTSTTKAFAQNGTDMGYLTDFKIDNSGVITGSYSNGMKRDIARIALARFTNPSGLEKSGETNFTETTNSGRALVGAAGTEIYGSVQSGTLEMSNVDLATEFTEMITTQRGFQANSRSITTSDTMLEEVLRLKR